MSDIEAMKTVIHWALSEDGPTPDQAMAALVYPDRNATVVFMRPISWMNVAETIASKMSPHNA